MSLGAHANECCGFESIMIDFAASSYHAVWEFKFRVEGSSTESCTERNSSQFKNNCFAKIWSGSEEGSYLRLIDFWITQL